MKIKLLTILFLPFFAACKKEDFSWNLKKKNEFEFSNFTQIWKKDNCESFDSISTKSSNPAWVLGEGYSGKGYVANGFYPLQIAFIELSKKTKPYTAITFINKFTSGTANADFTTNISVNGAEVNHTIIEESSDNSWQKLRLDTIFGGGIQKIKFSFSSSGSNNTVILDEIEIRSK